MIANVLRYRGKLLTCGVVILMFATGCMGTQAADQNTSTPALPTPLDDPSLCHVFSNELLQEEIGFYTEYYGYESSAPQSSSDWGHFECDLHSAYDVSESDTMYLIVMFNDPSASEIAEDASTQIDSKALTLGNHEGSGWVWDHGKSLVWQYPDGSSIYMWVNTLDESEWVPEENVREGLIVVFDSLIDEVPEYMQVAENVPFTRVPPGEED